MSALPEKGREIERGLGERKYSPFLFNSLEIIFSNFKIVQSAFLPTVALTLSYGSGAFSSFFEVFVSWGFVQTTASERELELNKAGEEANVVLPYLSD